MASTAARAPKTTPAPAARRPPPELDELINDRVLELCDARSFQAMRVCEALGLPAGSFQRMLRARLRVLLSSAPRALYDPQAASECYERVNADVLSELGATVSALRTPREA